MLFSTNVYLNSCMVILIWQPDLSAQTSDYYREIITNLTFIYHAFTAREISVSDSLNETSNRLNHWSITTDEINCDLASFSSIKIHNVLEYRTKDAPS